MISPGCCKVHRLRTLYRRNAIRTVYNVDKEVKDFIDQQKTQSTKRDLKVLPKWLVQKEVLRRIDTFCWLRKLKIRKILSYVLSNPAAHPPANTDKMYIALVQISRYEISYCIRKLL